MILARAGAGIRLNEHMEGDGPTVFAHACKSLKAQEFSLPLRTFA
jgi:hypothetical protein